MKVERISRIKKQKFLGALSEDEFRDSVIRPLFLRLGYSDGRELCGPTEAGKDALFSERDNLGFAVWTAVQTKKGNINLASQASSNLIQAITQLKTALETKYALLKDRQKVKPNRAILCASGAVNDAARHHIIEEVGNPNIQFLDVHDIVQLVDKHLPEFWLGIDADIQPYFRAIEAQVLGTNVSSMPTSQFQFDVLTGAATDESFVSLNLFKAIVRKRKVAGAIIEMPDFVEMPLNSILKHKSQKILILGDAGSGKSTSLLRIAYELAREGLEFEGKYKIPILVRASDIHRIKSADFVEFLDEQTKKVSGSAKSCFTLNDLQEGRVVLLIDSIDEVGTDHERRQLLATINQFSSAYPKIKVIATSRPYRFTSELPELRQYDDYRLSAISWRQAEKIFQRVQKGKSVPVSKSKEVLRRLEKIHGIELNPLLVTVFAAASDFAKQDIPANITELFKKFTELMLGRWDERKGLKRQYQAPLKDFIVTRIAFHMHLKKATNIQRKEIETIVNEELRKLGYEPEAEKLIGEIVDRSGLFKWVGDEVEFRHFLLQEFFAGRGIPTSEFIHQVISDEWWKRALVFYFGENPARIELLKEAMNGVTTSTGGQLFEAATTIGLSAQACYLSAVSDKLSVWKWVVHAVGIARDAALKAVDPTGRIPLTAFLSYYLYARDAVALANLPQNLDELTVWMESADFSSVDQTDVARFWLIVGLIESGDVDWALKLVKSYHPRDPRLLVAIHLGCFLAEHVRPLEDDQKSCAKEVCRRLASKIAPYRNQIIREWGSELIELRSGGVSNADDDVQA